MTFAESVCSLCAQGKRIPMVSGKDLVRLFKRLKKREKAQGIIRKIKPVPVAELGVDANAAGGAAGSTVQIAAVPCMPNNAVGEGGSANAPPRPQMMPQ